jgi:DNA-binding MarR family transcriptional regulator
MHDRGGKQAKKKLTLEQVYVLVFILKNKNPLMKEVADHLCVTAPSATVLIDSLVNAGFVKRVADKIDHRSVRLTVTINGKTELVMAKARVTKKMRSLLKNINDDDRRNLVIILNKFLEIKS